MEQEVWKDVPGEDSVQVSSHGRVRSFRVLKPKIVSGTGYPAVTVYRKGDPKQKTIHVHYLVALTFLGPRPPGTEVNHKDLNRANPRPENLEYITHRENALHGIVVGKRLKLSDEVMDRVADLYFVQGLSARGVARETGVTDKQVRSVLSIWRATWRKKRTRWEHKMTPEKKKQVCELYARGDVTQAQLGKMFEIDPSAISRITRAAAQALV